MINEVRGVGRRHIMCVLSLEREMAGSGGGSHYRWPDLCDYGKKTLQGPGTPGPGAGTLSQRR